MKNQGCLLMAEGGRGLDINRQSLLRNPKAFCRRSLRAQKLIHDRNSLDKTTVLSNISSFLCLKLRYVSYYVL